MKTPHTVDRAYKIYHDNEGWHVGIRDDADSLNLAEIFYEEAGAPEVMIVLPWDVAVTLAKTILEASSHHKVGEDEDV